MRYLVELRGLAGSCSVVYPRIGFLSADRATYSTIDNIIQIIYFIWGPIPAGKSTAFPRYVTLFFLYTNFPCLLSILDLMLVLIFNIVQETNVQKHSKVLHAHTLTTLIKSI